MNFEYYANGKAFRHTTFPGGPQGKEVTTAKALVAFIGICLRQRQSGSSVRGRTMISRAGHAALRKALYMPGRVALCHNPILQVFSARMKANGLAPKAVVGAAMRKLADLIYGVVKSGKPFDVATLSTGLQFKAVSNP